MAATKQLTGRWRYRESGGLVVEHDVVAERHPHDVVTAGSGEQNHCKVFVKVLVGVA